MPNSDILRDAQRLAAVWDNVLSEATELSSQIPERVSYDPDDRLSTYLSDYDEETGRTVTVEFDPQGNAVDVKVDVVTDSLFDRGASEKLTATKTIFLSDSRIAVDSISSRSHGPSIIARRRGKEVVFTRGITTKRRKEAIGYVGIIGAALEDVVERAVGGSTLENQYL